MQKGKWAIIKTSTWQTIFLPLIGLVPAENITPGELIGINKDSYLVLDTLPAEFDNHVKAMEVDEWPTETYMDIGWLEKQIEELVEVIALPMEQADKIKTIEIKPPKVWYSLSFWLPTIDHQELGKPFLRMHVLPQLKHVTWNKRCK